MIKKLLIFVLNVYFFGYLIFGFFRYILGWI